MAVSPTLKALAEVLGVLAYEEAKGIIPTDVADEVASHIFAAVKALAPATKEDDP